MIFNGSTCFHSLPKKKNSSQKAHHFERDVTLSGRKRRSLVVTEKCKAASRGKQIQEDAVPRISRPPQDTDHLTQMICQ